MIKEHVCKASPIGHDEVDDGMLVFDAEVPELETAISLDNVRTFYEKEAEKIMDVLNKCLPQGTRHALLVKMLQNSPIYYRGI